MNPFDPLHVYRGHKGERERAVAGGPDRKTAEDLFGMELSDLRYVITARLHSLSKEMLHFTAHVALLNLEVQTLNNRITELEHLVSPDALTPPLCPTSATIDTRPAVQTDPRVPITTSVQLDHKLPLLRESYTIFKNPKMWAGYSIRQFINATRDRGSFYYWIARDPDDNHLGSSILSEQDAIDRFFPPLTP